MPTSGGGGAIFVGDIGKVAGMDGEYQVMSVLAETLITVQPISGGVSSAIHPRSFYITRRPGQSGEGPPIPKSRRQRRPKEDHGSGGKPSGDEGGNGDGDGGGDSQGEEEGESDSDEKGDGDEDGGEDDDDSDDGDEGEDQDEGDDKDPYDQNEDADGDHKDGEGGDGDGDYQSDSDKKKPVFYLAKRRKIWRLVTFIDHDHPASINNDDISKGDEPTFNLGPAWPLTQATKLVFKVTDKNGEHLGLYDTVKTPSGKLGKIVWWYGAKRQRQPKTSILVVEIDGEAGKYSSWVASALEKITPPKKDEKQPKDKRPKEPPQPKQPDKPPYPDMGAKYQLGDIVLLTGSSAGHWVGVVTGRERRPTGMWVYDIESNKVDGGHPAPDYTRISIVNVHETQIRLATTDKNGERIYIGDNLRYIGDTDLKKGGIYPLRQFWGMQSKEFGDVVIIEVEDESGHLVAKGSKLFEKVMPPPSWPQFKAKGQLVAIINPGTPEPDTRGMARAAAVIMAARDPGVEYDMALDARLEASVSPEPIWRYKVGTKSQIAEPITGAGDQPLFIGADAVIAGTNQDVIIQSPFYAFSQSSNSWWVWVSEEPDEGKANVWMVDSKTLVTDGREKQDEPQYDGHIIYIATDPEPAESWIVEDWNEAADTYTITHSLGSGKTQNIQPGQTMRVNAAGGQALVVGDTVYANGSSRLPNGIEINSAGNPYVVAGTVPRRDAWVNVKAQAGWNRARIFIRSETTGIMYPVPEMYVTHTPPGGRGPERFKREDHPLPTPPTPPTPSPTPKEPPYDPGGDDPRPNQLVYYDGSDGDDPDAWGETLIFVRKERESNYWLTDVLGAPPQVYSARAVRAVACASGNVLIAGTVAFMAKTVGDLQFGDSIIISYGQGDGFKGASPNDAAVRVNRGSQTIVLHSQSITTKKPDEPPTPQPVPTPEPKEVEFHVGDWVHLVKATETGYVMSITKNSIEVKEVGGSTVVSPSEGWEIIRKSPTMRGQAVEVTSYRKHVEEGIDHRNTHGMVGTFVGFNMHLAMVKFDKWKQPLNFKLGDVHQVRNQPSPE